MLGSSGLRRAFFLLVAAVALLVGPSCTTTNDAARPVVTEVTPRSAKRGDLVTFRATATGNPTAYSYVFWQEGATPWTNAATARTDGPALITVTASGVFTGLVTATNAAGTSDPFAFQISVEDDPCFGVLFAEQELPHATTSLPYDFRFRLVSPTGFDTSTATFRVVSGALPDGMTLAADGRLSGTATAALPRTFTVAGTAGACRLEQSFTLTVQGGVDCSGFAFRAADKDVTLERYVPFDLHVGPDVDGGTVSHIEVAAGQLPLGVQTVDPDRVTGTPEANGDTNVTLRALRADGKCSATGRYRFIVRTTAGDGGTDAGADASDAGPPASDGGMDAASDAAVATPDGSVAGDGGALMTMSGSGVALAVVGGTVYATAKGEDSLWAVSTTGQNPHKVATHANPPSGVLTHLGGQLYTVAYSQATGTGGLYKAAASGTGAAATALVSGKPYPSGATANRYGVATDGTDLFWSDDGDPGLHRTTIAGTDSSYTATGASIAHLVAADATHVYYTDSSVDHSIRRTNVGLSFTPKMILSGSNMASLVGRPLAMTLYGGLVYVVGMSNSVTGISPGAGELDAPNVTYTSGSLSSVIGGGVPSSIAVDASGVYVGVAQGLNPGAGVYRFALSGVAPAPTLVAPADGVAAVAVDATHVYFISGASVYRVAK